MIKISPSLLSADFLNLHSDVKLLEESGADSIHIDVMDGHFVPNFTFGPVIIEQIKRITSIPIEVHLMILNAEQTFQDYINAGADTIFVHSEACFHLDRMVNAIKSQGVKVGVALNPATSEEALRYLYNSIDAVLIMTVNPGFASQTFLTSQLDKVGLVRRRIVELGVYVTIAVDGGINAETANLVVSAGAETLITGSYLFSNRKNLGAKIASLRSLV
ncbi:ribulose-phosphate 3-epimerase [Neorickettsia risticii]|uniref:Ribulose-phosphate 3-epimerase n=1 Tax=Neorickettsia risticii (strain Illinois) TaxID=434131 RepID=C6V4J9_NEORI|nr:ribulose-phosphate 3-epimerase [Neorickettsia risticii]ACT69316.1 ribulose-phosphate 3-epimerase [Neorickettsia risticii str. Illinois]